MKDNKSALTVMAVATVAGATLATLTWRFRKSNRKPQLEYRRLGKTNYEVSTVSFGAWAIGGAWGATDDKTAKDALNAFLDAGGNMIDTANVYGDAYGTDGFGRSEKLIREVLQERAAAGKPLPGGRRIIVCTKAGRAPGKGPECPHSSGYSYTYEQLRASAEASCRRLGVRCLDLLQLHCPPEAVLVQGEAFRSLDRLKAEGLISHWGVSVETVHQADLAILHPSCATIQIIYNMFRLKPTNFMSRAAAADVGVLARVPLASGLLTGKFDAAALARANFADNDHRKFNRAGECFDAGETWSGLGLVLEEAAVPAVAELRGLLGAQPELRGASMPHLALRWILANPAVTCAIPGCRTVAQVKGNLRAAEVGQPALEQDTMRKVKEVYYHYIRPHVHSKW